MADTNVIARHDAILPFEYEGVLWGVANLGDNTETENSAMAELFESINRHMLALSNVRDCFVVNPPSIEAVKAHHNMYVRLMKFIDSRTKADNEARLDFAHITPVRRKFATYPVRYFDQKNRWTRRWTELYLYGLSNLAQMSEANTWTNDWNVVSAAEMKKPFREAYRLMAVELFDIPLADAKAVDYRLPVSAFENYAPSTLIPTYEWQEHPFVDHFTEDVLKGVSVRHVPLSDFNPDAPNPGASSYRGSGKNTATNNPGYKLPGDGSVVGKGASQVPGGPAVGGSGTSEPTGDQPANFIVN